MEKQVDEMTLSNKEYAALTAQASNYRVILRYLKAGGFDNFLINSNRAAIDLVATPDDMTGGESAIFFLKTLADECVSMDTKIKDLSQALLDTTIALAKQKRIAKALEPKTLWQKLKNFVFVPLEERE